MPQEAVDSEEPLTGREPCWKEEQRVQEPGVGQGSACWLRAGDRAALPDGKTRWLSASAWVRWAIRGSCSPATLTLHPQAQLWSASAEPSWGEGCCANKQTSRNSAHLFGVYLQLMPFNPWYIYCRLVNAGVAVCLWVLGGRYCSARVVFTSAVLVLGLRFVCCAAFLLDKPSCLCETWPLVRRGSCSQVRPELSANAWRTGHQTRQEEAPRGKCNICPPWHPHMAQRNTQMQ